MVKLRNVGISRSYQRNLRDAGQWLVARVVQRGHKLTRASPPQLVDAWLEEAVQRAHEEGERLYWVTLGVLGVQRQLKLSAPLLRGTWKAIQGWRSLKPVRSRIPISALALEGAVLGCLREGWNETGWLRKQLWACGLALWMGFIGLFRPGEVLNLKVGDLSFSTSGDGAILDPGMVVVVRNPKTKRIWHRQFVLCRDERLEKWMRWWVHGVPRGRPLFPLTRYLWNKYFQEVLTRLSLEGCGFTLGSLRAGGATYHFRKHGNLGTLQFLGRWTSSNTMQFYLQEAFSMHVESQLNEVAQRNLSVLQRFSHLLNDPPVSPLSQLVRRG